MLEDDGGAAGTHMRATKRAANREPRGRMTLIFFLSSAIKIFAKPKNPFPLFFFHIFHTCSCSTRQAKPAMQAFLDSLAPEEAATFGHLAAARPERMRRILQAVISDIETMDATASDIPPAVEPVTDYITEIDVRCQLFTKLRAMLPPGDDEWQSIPDVTVMAMFMVAPLHELRLLIEGCESNYHGSPLVGNVCLSAHRAIRACTSHFPVHICFFYPD